MHHLRSTSKIIGQILFKYQRSHSFTGVRIYYIRNFAHFSSNKDDDTKAGDDQSVSYKNPQKLNQVKVKKMKMKQEMDIDKMKMKQDMEREMKKMKQDIEREMKNFEKEIMKKIEKMEDEEKKKKQEKEKEKEKEKKTSKIIFFSTIGFITGIPSSLLNYQLIKKQKQIKNEFSQQSMDDGQSYFDGKYIETQIKTILDSKDIKGRITLLMGVPGIGKSVTIKKYIKKQRQNGRTVYYFSLKNRQKNVYGDEQKLIFLMRSVMDDQKKKKKDPKNNTDMFVIDDINIIEKFNEKQSAAIQSLCINLRMSGVTVVLISSSTSFFYNVWKKITQLIQKGLGNKQFLINGMKDNEFNQVLEKKANELGITNKNVIDKVKDLGLTMRQSISCLLDLNQKDQTKALSKINQLKTQKQELCHKQIFQVLENKQLSIAVQRKIINIILQFKTSQNVNLNYILLKDKIKEGAKQLNLKEGAKKLNFSNSFKITKALDDLDSNNLIIFGTPRSKLIRRTMENYLNILQEPLKGQNQTD